MTEGKSLHFLRLLGTSAFVTALFCGVPPPARADGYQPGSPCTCLFDTGSASAGAWSPAAVATKKNWRLLAEDDLTHKFTGDTVLLNDRVIVVLRVQGGGAETYALADGRAAQRAQVALGGPRGVKARLAGVRILENNPGAVMVEATFLAGFGSRATVVYRLTTGQPMLEVRAGAGAEKLLVGSPARYVIVPDFFGDDMVFAADSSEESRLRLPAENFLLGLVDGGGAMVMCVWPSGKQNAEAILAGTGPQRAIQGWEIECVKDKPLWIALLEGSGIWHQRSVSSADAAFGLTLDWKPPFPAKWRADLVTPQGFARSWYFRGMGEPDELSLLLNRGSSPCSFDAAQQAVVELRQVSEAVVQGVRYPRPLVVYPIDRSRTTPLTAFCPIDILRSTLGMGPCQYILQTEGLTSETNPTPDSVMTWVEKQFAKKKEKKSADEIRDLLKQMRAHMAHAQARLGRYEELARDVRTACRAQTANAQTAPSAKALLATVDYLEQALAATSTAPKPPETAAKVADQVLALIGKEEPAAECRRLGTEIRRLGTLQDGTLARCRMSVRWLKQQAAMIAARVPAFAGPAQAVQTQADEVLGSR